MRLVGLTGGIASGKSTIAARLSELGAVHIDADRLAREIVEPGSPVLGRIAAALGDELLQPDGTLDRAALSARVFADPGALETLNAITHPAVRALSEQRIERAKAEDPDAVVVYDVPLLVEAKVQMPWDLIVVAEAPAETRIGRMIELRGMTRAQAEQRIARQASDAERRAVADVVIDTGGTLEHTIAQVDELWARLRSADQASSRG